MSWRKFVCVAALAALAIPAAATAQQSYGDGFGVGGVFLPSDAPVLVGNTRIGDSLGLEFSIEITLLDDDDTSASDLGAGIGVKKYLTERKQFQPFIGGRFGFHHCSSDNGHNETDDTRFGVTGSLGGEYFVTRTLSLEGQIGFDLYFGSVELGTMTRLAALFYL
jgi:hypothetical protein